MLNKRFANCVRQVHMIHNLLNFLKQLSMQLTDGLQEHILQDLKQFLIISITRSMD